MPAHSCMCISSRGGLVSELIASEFFSHPSSRIGFCIAVSIYRRLDSCSRCTCFNFFLCLHLSTATTVVGRRGICISEAIGYGFFQCVYKERGDVWCHMNKSKRRTTGLALLLSFFPSTFHSESWTSLSLRGPNHLHVLHVFRKEEDAHKEIRLSRRVGHLAPSMQWQ